MPSDKNEDGNHKNCTFKYFFELYIVLNKIPHQH